MGGDWAQVISRWWLTFDSIVWPDKLAMDLVAFLPGQGRERKVGHAFDMSLLLLHLYLQLVYPAGAATPGAPGQPVGGDDVEAAEQCRGEEVPHVPAPCAGAPAAAPWPGGPPHREGDGPARAAHHRHREQALCQHRDTNASVTSP